jgi:hypothetical protein
MKKRIRLTEAELIKLITRVINEQNDELESESEFSNSDLLELIEYRAEIYEMASDILGEEAIQYSTDEVCEKLMETGERSARHLAKEIKRVDSEFKMHKNK